MRKNNSNTKGYFHIDHNITLPEYYNPYTLNIFSDASYGAKGKPRGAYAVVCVCGDTIIDSFTALCGYNNIVVSETRGLRRALDMGLQYARDYSYINIFSDSQLAIQTVRDFIYHWKYDAQNQVFKNQTGKPVKNQGLIIECNQMYTLLKERTNAQILHQKGHVDNGYTSIENACSVFKSSNSISGKVDLNFIRYISTWNNFVDNRANKKVREDRSHNPYNDPFTYLPKQVPTPTGYVVLP